MSYQQQEKPLSAESVALVAMDLDGTLLRTDNTISVKTAEAIAEARERGVRFVLASGRAPRHVYRIAAALGLTTLQIAHNGAIIVDPVRKGFLFHQTLPPELGRAVVDFIHQFDARLQIGLEVVDVCITEKASGNPDMSEAGTKAAPQTMTFEEALRGPVTKVMVAGPPEILGGIQLALMERLGKQVAFSASHLRLLQIVHAGVDKGTSLARVARHYNIPRSQVMAIGDAPNDIGMLKWAGLSLAVANAWEDVRRAAHLVVPSNDDDAVAWAVRKYILGS